nr:uncharacterized protein LOC109151045 isoform X3 [Ipomoea batatas]
MTRAEGGSWPGRPWYRRPRRGDLVGGLGLGDLGLVAASALHVDLVQGGYNLPLLFRGRFIATSAYIVLQLFQLSSQDPAYYILFNRQVEF